MLWTDASLECIKCDGKFTELYPNVLVCLKCNTYIELGGE